MPYYIEYPFDAILIFYSYPNLMQAQIKRILAYSRGIPVTLYIS